MAAITTMFSAVKTRALSCLSKPVSNLLIQQRNYAKRRGVKAAKAAKTAKSGKLDVDAAGKRGLVAKSSKTKAQVILSKMDKNIRTEEPVDNVYCFHNYKFQCYSIADAIKLHAEAHHPSIYNDPDAVVNAFMELDMSLHHKQNKCLDKFISKVYYPNELNVSEPYKVLVICKKPEEAAAAKEAGAYLVVDTDYVKKIKKGEVPHDDFDHCVTTPDLLPELVPIRGILNKRFPNLRAGSVGFEIAAMVKKLSNSMEYRIIPNPPEPQYAWLNVSIGKLQMPIPQIEENLTALLTDICQRKPSKMGPPIIRLLFLTCPPTHEKFLIQHEKYVPVEEEDSDDEAKTIKKFKKM